MTTRKLPTQKAQITTVTKHELKKLVHSKKIIGVIGVTLLLTLLFVVLPETQNVMGFANVEPTSYAAIKVAHLLYLIVILAVMIGGNTLSSEFSQKTGYTLFPEPVTRTSIWLGKFIASQIVLFAILTIYYISISMGLLYNFGAIPVELLWSFLFALLVSTAVMSVVFLFSSMFKSTAITVVATLVLLLMALPALQLYLSVVAKESSMIFGVLLTFAAGIIVTVLTPEAGSFLGFFGNVEGVPTYQISVIVFTFYILVCGFLSIINFKRKDM